MRQLLRDRRHGKLAGKLEFAAVGSELPAQQGEQRRFAAAVPPDKPDFFAAKNADRYVLEQWIWTATKLDIA